MSFISVPVLAKKLEAYIWLHCDMVAQTIYSKKIFCYLTQTPPKHCFVSVFLSRKNGIIPTVFTSKKVKSWICYLYVAVEIMLHHRKK